MKIRKFCVITIILASSITPSCQHNGCSCVRQLKPSGDVGLNDLRSRLLQLEVGSDLRATLAKSNEKIRGNQVINCHSRLVGSAVLSVIDCRFEDEVLRFEIESSQKEYSFLLIANFAGILNGSYDWEGEVKLLRVSSFDYT